MASLFSGQLVRWLACSVASLFSGQLVQWLACSVASLFSGQLVQWPACSVAQYIISLLVYTCADRWHCRSHNKARNPTPLAATHPALYNHCRLVTPILVGCHGNRLFVPWGSTGSSQAQEYCLRTTSPQTQMCADKLHPLRTAKGISSLKVARGHATYIDIKMLNFSSKAVRQTLEQIA